MFKATEVERKIRNKSTYQYANKFLFMQKFRPLFLTVYAAIITGLVRNEKCITYACAKFLESKQIMTAEKMW